MSRFKTCGIVDCEEKVSRSNPHIVKLVTVDEAFGKHHGHIPGEGKGYEHYGEPYISKMTNIKLKICNYCYQEFKDGQIGFMRIGGINRKLESFDAVKNIAYYVLATKEDEENNDINDTDYYNGSNGIIEYGYNNNT